MSPLRKMAKKKKNTKKNWREHIFREEAQLQKYHSTYKTLQIGKQFWV